MLTNSNIIESKDLPLKEKVYLKKDMFGYRIVYPIYNEDGKINYMNLLFGGKRNLILSLIIFFLLLFLYVGVNELISSYKVIAEKPCDFCYTTISDCYTTNNFSYTTNSKGGDKNEILQYNLSLYSQKVT